MKPPTASIIEPRRLNPDSRFRFRCGKDLPCFTQCCRGIHIILTPFDILRLKRRLGLPSTEFLALYTEPQLLEKTDIPVVTLRGLQQEGAGEPACPFVRPEGCLVYEDRPASCRYYPVGTATLAWKGDPDGDAFYFLVREAHCRGLAEDREWTVLEWRNDQGVDEHDRVNAPWTELILRKRSFPGALHWTEKAKELFFLVSYDLDRFRRFVFESSFLRRYPVAAEETERLKTDEAALLHFGLRWLKDVLFRPPAQ